jgi:hypothetical protein
MSINVEQIVAKAFDGLFPRVYDGGGATICLDGKNCHFKRFKI